MASSWGTAWGTSWADSWGAGVTPPLGPLPIGTVPIRYILGQTKNVVPVITVVVYEIGVVFVREFVGPAHVVPVREVTTETPHVKVMAR